ncbi:unnamed protein product [Caenorhabditis nigoni]
MMRLFFVFVFLFVASSTITAEIDTDIDVSGVLICSLDKDYFFEITLFEANYGYDDDNITRLRPWTFEGRGNTSYHTFGGAFGDRHGSYWYRLYLEIIHDCARCLGYHCPRRFKYDLGNFRVRSGLIDIQENINITNQGKPIIGGYDV